MRDDASSGGWLGARWFFVLAAGLIALHVAFTVAAGAHSLTFLSGGSDAPAYALLASNLLHHLGFTYAGQPTAFRPPGYPVFLAALTLLFGRFWILAVRWIQFLACIATAWFCGLSAHRLFGRSGARASFVVGLLLPTQVFASAQILTECMATLFVAIFLYCMVLELKKPSAGAEIGMGVATAAAAILRFNAAALALIAAVAVLRLPGRRRLWGLAYVVILPILLLSPWLVRNLIVFHGHALFSTQGGNNMVRGVLTPAGRTQSGDTRKIIESLGWDLSQLETNGPERAQLPSEADLDRECMKIVPRLWAQIGWHAAPLLAGKVADFWLSADQVLDTKGLTRSSRLIRFGGVVVYWCVLILAILGWRRLRRIWPLAANIFLFYVLAFTALHLPLVMSTRIRFPLMDPLVATLAGGALVRLNRVGTGADG